MDKIEKRKEFLSSLKEITNHMNWCKIKLNPDDNEYIDDSRIENDYIGWSEDDDEIMEKLRELQSTTSMSLIDLVFNIHLLVCKYFSFDDRCHFLSQYDSKNDICTIEKKYGREPDDNWIADRKTHNKRICFELSRYVAFRVKQFANEQCDVFLVSDKYESHYATAVISQKFMIIVDTDDFIKGEDLRRAKLGIEIKGITILNDGCGVVEEALKNVNCGRISKKDFEIRARSDKIQKQNFEWICTLWDKIKCKENDEGYYYMKSALETRGFEPVVMFEKKEGGCSPALYMLWNMDYMIIKSSGVEVIRSKQFVENIRKGMYFQM